MGFHTLKAPRQSCLPDAPQTLPVKRGVTDAVALTYAAPGRYLMPKGEGGTLQAVVELPEGLTAPIAAGQTVGRVTIRNGDTELQSYPITAAQDAEALSFGYCLRRLAESLILQN